MYPDGLAEEDYCYLTTTGRVTGQPHEIEIWFALEGATLYMLSGGERSDWMKNTRRTPETTVTIDGSTYEGRGRIVDGAEEDGLARWLLFEKYQPRTGGDLTRWRGPASPVAGDLNGSAEEGRGR